MVRPEKRRRKRRLNKIDVYLIVLSVLCLGFIVWAAIEFHRTQTEPAALIAMVGAYVVAEIWSLAKIKVAKEENNSCD